LLLILSGSMGTRSFGRFFRKKPTASSVVRALYRCGCSLAAADTPAADTLPAIRYVWAKAEVPASGVKITEVLKKPQPVDATGWGQVRSVSHPHVDCSGRMLSASQTEKPDRGFLPAGTPRPTEPPLANDMHEAAGAPPHNLRSRYNVCPTDPVDV
jgi:hypothetical protein